jgi:hypothetical protein
VSLYTTAANTSGRVAETGDGKFCAYDSTDRLIGTFAKQLDATRAIPAKKVVP